jgi:hypothetical protein
MLVYRCCFDLQLFGETVREIVDLCTVVEKDFARMGVDEYFCSKKPKMRGLKCVGERGIEEMGGSYGVWR